MGEKFKEFYFTGDQRLHNLDELEKEYEQKVEIYRVTGVEYFVQNVGLLS